MRKRTPAPRVLRRRLGPGALCGLVRNGEVWVVADPTVPADTLNAYVRNVFALVDPQDDHVPVQRCGC